MAHTSQYFTQLLQICSFFKLFAKPFENQLPEVIKLMTIDELYANIVHDKFETTLMKTIIVFLLNQTHNPKFEKQGLGGTSHFLVGSLRSHRQEIIDHYYLQMALQQYLLLTESKKKGKDFVGVYNFYELDLETKFNMLSTLVKNANQNCFKDKSKTKSDNDDNAEEKKKEQGKSKGASLTQPLLLGQDGQYLYFFFPFLSDYVLTFEMGKWLLLDKQAVANRIQTLLDKPMSTNNLALMQNLSNALSKFMTTKSQVQTHIRFHQVKQKPAQRQKVRIAKLRKKLLSINDRYSVYLKNYGNRCWGILKHRQHYVDSLLKASSLLQLIEAFFGFYMCSAREIYICSRDNEESIPQKDAHSFYQAHLKNHANINLVYVKLIDKLLGVQSGELTQRIMEDEPADKYALFQVNVLVLEIALEILEKKAMKYFEKIKKAEIIEKTKRNSDLSSLQSSRINKDSKMELRKKANKPHKRKMFGVSIIDSDDQSYRDENSSESFDLDMYKYKLRGNATK